MEETEEVSQDYSMEEIEEEYTKPQNFAELPEFILLKIFSHLPTVNDIVCAGRVCSQWHAVSKDESLWKQITLNALRLPQHQIGAFLQNIPSNISYLKIENSFRKRIVLNKKSGLVLKESCPNLKIFIMENFVLSPSFLEPNFSVECLPSTVCVISLRGSIVDPEYFFIDSRKCNCITVVDLSFCQTLKNEHLGWFHKMRNLKELYLAGCSIDDTSMVKLFETRSRIHPRLFNLKVFDLEGTNITDRSISYEIKLGLPYLEKLFLGRTNVTFDWGSYLSEERHSFQFPLLTDLCLKNTSVDGTILCSLVTLKSMKCINVVSNDIIKDCISNLSENLKAKFKFHDEIKPMQNCNHFNKKYAN